MCSSYYYPRILTFEKLASLFSKKMKVEVKEEIEDKIKVKENNKITKIIEYNIMMVTLITNDKIMMIIIK